MRRGHKNARLMLRKGSSFLKRRPVSFHHWEAIAEDIYAVKTMNFRRTSVTVSVCGALWGPVSGLKTCEWLENL